ncbi:metallophosphoesterase family protein [Thermodesulfobacteriota bacterium]
MKGTVKFRTGPLLPCSILFALYTFAVGCSDDPSGRVWPDFTFAVISDTHVDEGLLNPGNYNFWACANRLNGHEAPIDLVVHTGDLVNIVSSEDPEYFDSHHTEIDTFANLASRFVMPLYFLLGNHDYYVRILNRIAEDHLAMEQIWFETLGIEAWSSFEYNGVRFVLLNSMQDYEDRLAEGDWWTGAFGDEQVAWLDDELAGGLPTLLFFHHDIEEVPVDDPIYGVIDEHRDRIAGIFAGHNHDFTRGTLYGVPYFSTAAIKWSAGHVHIVEFDHGMSSIRIVNELDIDYDAELGEIME